MHINWFSYFTFIVFIFSADGKKATIKTPIKSHIVPKTNNQFQYNQLLSNDHLAIVVGTGPAGCGKTLFACNEAIRRLKSGSIEKIVITRPIISVDDEQLGFLPGSMNQKMDPWTRPIFDIFTEYFNKQQMKTMVDNNIIEIVPLAYMRGRTFKNSFIIADEMQNSSPNQMLMLLTRIGEDSKLAITGDLKQTDRPGNNGLGDFLEKLKKSVKMQKHVAFIEMKSEDIQRNEILAEIIELYK